MEAWVESLLVFLFTENSQIYKKKPNEPFSTFNIISLGFVFSSDSGPIVCHTGLCRTLIYGFL